MHASGTQPLRDQAASRSNDLLQVVQAAEGCATLHGSLCHMHMADETSFVVSLLLLALGGAANLLNNRNARQLAAVTRCMQPHAHREPEAARWMLSHVHGLVE